MRNVEQVYEEMKVRFRREGEGIELRRLFARRLRRPLTAAEEAAFGERLGRLGAERFEELLFERDAQGVAAWLADPGAR